MAVSSLLIFTCVVVYVQAHGFLRVPPNRASLWRYGYDTPPDYDDDGMNCGGIQHRIEMNGDKCGICGDAYDEPQPRAHELGGQYGKGIIVAHYEAGQTITTNIYISAAHLGYWELRICPNPYHQEQECFDNGYLLELEDGGTKYHLHLQLVSAYFNVTYRLPRGLTCEHCVLQWQYTAGNNWGLCANGTDALGCGSQEKFFSCTDISISRSSRSSGPIDTADDLKGSYNRNTDSQLAALNPWWRRQHRGSRSLPSSNWTRLWEEPIQGLK